MIYNFLTFNTSCNYLKLLSLKSANIPTINSYKSILNMEEEVILVTAALPYVNHFPHIGHIVGCHLPADIFARFNRISGKKVIFLGGTDENGSVTEITALKLGVTEKELVDKMHLLHKKIYDWFEISYDIFGRTSSKNHHKLTQEIFKLLYENGYIVEKELTLPYCPKDKIFLPDRFVIGKCPYCGYEKARGDQCEKCGSLLDPDQLIDPKCNICGTKPIFKKRKHLFLDLPKLAKEVKEWIEKNKYLKHQVKNWALSIIKGGLKERCITRDLRWGVKVPLKGYENKVFYVWFDAPIGYISFLLDNGINPDNIWGKNSNSKIYHFLGKDNIPFHTVWWPCILIGTKKYKLPTNVVGLQYLNYEGRKISKSHRWGVFCENLLKLNIPADVWRFYLSFVIPETKDTEFTWREFKERINKDLVGNLLNFYYRVISFTYKNYNGKVKGYLDESIKKKIGEIVENYKKLMNDFRFKDSLMKVLELGDFGNKYFQENEPWKKIKENREEVEKILSNCLYILRAIFILAYPFIPDFSKKVLNKIGVKDEIKIDLIYKKVDEWKVEKPEIIFKYLDEKDIERIKKEVTKISNLEDVIKEEISHEDFLKVDIRVGKIVDVKKISEKTYKLKIKIGAQEKTCIASIAEYYKEDELLGKKVCVITNLKPKKILGELSEVMLLAAVYNDEELSLIVPEKDIEDRARVL